MASTQKKTTANSGKRSSSASRPKQTAKSRPAARRKSAQPARKPLRREIGAGVFLLLALFAAIGYFKTDDGAFIALFCNLLKGLCGYGFYIAPPMLLACAVILMFHRGLPVRLRLTGSLLLPPLLGGLLHLILCKEVYEWGWPMFAVLWKDGLAMSSGGALGGVIALAFRFAFGGVGAMLVVILLMAAAALCALRLTPMDIVSYLKEQRDSRPEYDPEDYPEPVRPPRPARQDTGKARKPVIDIPVDDGPLTGKKPTTPVTTVRRKNLFDKVPGVEPPDRLLTGQKSEPVLEEPPEYEDVPDVTPAAEPVRPARQVTEPEPLPAPEPVSESAPEPVPPPVIREPAVAKAPPQVTRDDAQAAREQVAREIEAGMEQEAPAYRYPPISLLNEGREPSSAAAGELQTNQQRLEDALRSFGVDAHIVNVVRGPAITRYELELEQGVKLNKITNLSDDIALALGAKSVRVAPIPGKISTVGIEVPNRSVTPVAIREVLSSAAFTGSKSKVSFAVGKDIAGNCIVGDIARMPHMLIAGTTGSGKSVCTNSLIVSLLYKATPEEVRLIMVDPKMVELAPYNGIPHLLIPVVTDPKKAAGALQWAVNEMMKRYRMFSEVGAKDLVSYNNHARKDGRETMPQIVVVIDELADLMVVAAKEVEESICRVAQMGRAAGMHLVVATQRPSSDVITGLMKANIPSRIAFAVDGAINSRIILDASGAEKLVGKGDMLYAPLGQDRLRVQGCFISEEEVANVVEFVKEGASARYDEEVMHEIDRAAEEKDKAAKGVGGADPSAAADDYDELLPAAIDVVLEVGQASVSMLQRRLKLGYGRAARLVDQMEEKGVVGPFEGSKPRQLLITKEQWAEMQYKQDMTPGPVPEEFPYERDAVEQDRDTPPFDE